MSKTAKKPATATKVSHGVGTTLKLSPEHRALLAETEESVRAIRARLLAEAEALHVARARQNETIRVIGAMRGLTDPAETWTFDIPAGTVTRTR